MYHTITTGKYLQLKYVEEEIDKAIKRIKEYYIFYPYITHYMYDMHTRAYSARITYFAIERHPNRK